MSLQRTGGLDDINTVVDIDRLRYIYHTGSNQIKQLSDGSASPQGFYDRADGINAIDYTFDANGNMLTDVNKNISGITYNHLNLPTEIIFAGATQKINYYYNAAGNKVKKIITDGTQIVTIDYLNGFQYKNSVLQFFPTAEGYVDYLPPTGTKLVPTYNYIYQYKDHLGNVRMNYTYSPPLKSWPGGVVIKDESHYYPFGLKHVNYNMDDLEYQEIEGDIVLYPPLSTTGKLTYNYKYNGKELQDELGLGVYDMEARNYMPDIARWGNMDELGESFYNSSPYTFSNNNPVTFSDPSGLAAEHMPNHQSSAFVNSSGIVVEHRDDNDNNVYLVGNNWNPGDSKSGLGVLGHEIQGVDYTKGNRIRIGPNGSAISFNGNHTIKPIGGPFDLTGAWEAFWTEMFSSSDAEESLGTSIALAFFSRGKANPKMSVRALSGLLKAGKLHKHHVLSQQFRKWFISRGINNIDDYTIQISSKNHLTTIHAQGKWNQQWLDFITANPNATPSQIFYQAESMLKNSGLEHSKYIPYKR